MCWFNHKGENGILVLTGKCKYLEFDYLNHSNPVK